MYLCSENKGADQLRNYCAAHLHFCFRIYAKIRFSQDGAHISRAIALMKILWKIVTE